MVICMKKKIKEILSDIKKLQEDNIENCKLPENTFYLNDSDILCLERSNGESRYPYEMDGLNLWACASGYISACESNLSVFRPASVPEESSVEFWGGLKERDRFIPISITGATKQMFEPEMTERYTVYSKRAAYYIVKTNACIFALRANVTSEKRICFTLSAINCTEHDLDVSISSYIDPMLRFSNNEDGWALLKRYGWYNGKDSFKITRYPNPENQDIQNITNIAVINRAVKCQNPYEIESTVSKSIFFGEKGRCLFNASALKNGYFSKKVHAINAIDLPVAAEISKLHLVPDEEAQITYLITVVHDETAAEIFMSQTVDFNRIENDLAEQEKTENERLSGLSINFKELKNIPVSSNVFNRFLKNVQKQVTFCALGKNYAGDLLGVRDVFQQLTAALMWDRKDVRRQIVMALNFIMEDGRAPRQFSVPPREDVIPTFDIRQFIDQGLWIVETLYKYLSWTENVSILEEKCSYYRIIDEKKAQYCKSNCVDTVLEHLLKIIDYLISNIDERTDCLKILYGDWNDAVCGLGESLSGETEFGSGVSVMATLQLYKALKEMSEILEIVGGYTELRRKYEEIRERIAEGLEKYAMQKDGERTHLIHGWGDEGKYLVGSLCDNDGKCRYSVNPYSFWCISGMIERNPSLKQDILKAYDVLDSKYGIRTFEPYFPEDMKGVGRIASLTPGTYENGCAYIHATMFAVMALFELGEAEKAWKQIEKAIPITHKFVSKTPFVMPNSYCFNEEFCIDGESAGDWYTGSGAVLMRCIIEHALGIQATPKGIKIAVPDYLPSDCVDITLPIKHSKLSFSYKNTGAGKRTYRLNGAEYQTVENGKGIFLENAELTELLNIEVRD